MRVYVKFKIRYKSHMGTLFLLLSCYLRKRRSDLISKNTFYEEIIYCLELTSPSASTRRIMCNPITPRGYNNDWILSDGHIQFPLHGYSRPVAITFVVIIYHILSGYCTHKLYNRHLNKTIKSTSRGQYLSENTSVPTADHLLWNAGVTMRTNKPFNMVLIDETVIQ